MAIEWGGIEKLFERLETDQRGKWRERHIKRQLKEALEPLLNAIDTASAAHYSQHHCKACDRLADVLEVLKQWR